MDQPPSSAGSVTQLIRDLEATRDETLRYFALGAGDLAQIRAALS
jgi:hypothetical protein